ncbi:SixA phosphatase family protein [Trueperella pyogenes]|uniref:SixA phosphatase family protein n=1 Tax=Trueperella pyogenes TaxID=1661 RepID=UPI00345C84EA
MKRLIIMRHAQASRAWDDHSRPLSDHGRMQAAVVGGELSRSVGLVDQAFVSDAVRTRQTFDALTLGGLRVASCLIEAGLYVAGGDDVVDMIRAQARGDVVMVLGHEPTMSAVAYQLWDGLGKARFASGFPTAGAAVLAFAGQWWDLPLNSLSLEQFIA